MLPGFGKQTIVLGSAPHCDVVLQGPGVAPEHARIVHQGGGKLVLLDAGVGPTSANGQPLAAGGQAPFDFRTNFACGSAAVPLNHPAIVQMLMARGQHPAPPNQLVIGRDVARASLVIHHPSVSSQHATVMLDRMQVVDHSSTSGTWVGPARIAPATPTALDPNGVVAFGPVPVPVMLLQQALQHLASAPPPQASTAGASGFTPPGAMAPMPGGPPGSQAPGMPPGSQMPGMPPGSQVPGAPYGPPPGSAVPSGGAMVPMSPMQPQPYKKAQTVLHKLAMTESKDRWSIGRTPNNDIPVEHPQVSSRHAELRKSNGQLWLFDANSANGTFLVFPDRPPQRIAPGQGVPVQNGQRVMIGPRPLVIQIEDNNAQLVDPNANANQQANWGSRPLYEVEAWGVTVEVPDRDNPGEMKRLLNEVSFKALPGDMIALMGPSGAGKTTLLMTLNGYKPPTGGVVRVNGEDLYDIYDALRGIIGYVPQDDIVHPELTVFEAVKYSARFRLPPDYSDEEINQRVMATLGSLGLESIAHLEIGKPEKKVLSGGQRKRVNIALELVTDPVILFLDEPTSGLAADDTTSLIKLLSDLSRSTGKTIIMTIHQPAKDEYERFNLALILGYGGIPIFYGPTRGDSYRFFGSWKEKVGQKNDVDNPRDMFNMIAQREGTIFDQIRAQNPSAPKVEARKIAANQWRQEFVQSETFKRMYAGDRAVGEAQSRRHGVPDRASSTSGQFGLLLSRYAKVKFRDKGGTAIMFLQAPIIGGLLALAFGGQTQAKPFWCIGALQELKSKMPGGGGAALDTNQMLNGMSPTYDHSTAIFFLVISAVWFGTSNAAREIVSERAIYMRERMVNLGLFNYMFSKFALLCFFCVIQCTILLAIVFFTLGFHGGMAAFGLELANMVVVSFCAVSIGLMLSTMVESSEAAMALTPIVLIPQVILGGTIVPMTTNSTVKWLMYGVPARWGFQGAVAQERVAIADNKEWIIGLGQAAANYNDPNNYITSGRFFCAKAQLASEDLSGAWGFHQYEQTWLPFAVLGGMTLSLMIVLLFLLRRRDPV